LWNFGDFAVFSSSLPFRLFRHCGFFNSMIKASGDYMKRLVLTMACALAAVLFAADRAVCKYCGASNFGSLQQMLTSACSQSPRRYHDPL
jgi:hypothetical protein